VAAAAPATAYGTHVLDRKFSIHWLTRIYAFNIQQVNRQTPELDRRLDGWAERVADAVRSGEWDEVLVVGHSTGAQAAVSLVARALKLEPDPGNCQLSLLTLGGSIPMLAWWPQAQWFRDELERVATHPELEWIDFTIAQDGACFALHDPVESSGIAHPQGAEPKPKLLSAKLFDLYSPETFDAVRRNWYKVHFQYLMAGERLGDYDYFAITAGPLTLSNATAIGPPPAISTGSSSRCSADEPVRPAPAQAARRNLSLLGRMLFARRDNLGFLRERNYSMKMASYRAPGFNLFVVNEPKLARSILIGDWERFPKATCCASRCSRPSAAACWARSARNGSASAG
jgi:pimeloyl-ACP methyl ester carboxylesterase